MPSLIPAHLFEALLYILNAKSNATIGGGPVVASSEGFSGDEVGGGENA
jgi:hypothetical protein